MQNRTLITEAFSKLLRIVTPEVRNCFVEEVRGVLTKEFVEFEWLGLLDQWKRLSKTRVVVNQDKKVLVLSNSSNFHWTFDVHMDPFAGFKTVPPAGTKRLGAKLR